MAPGRRYLPDVAPKAMDYFLTWRYRGAMDFKETAKLLHEDTIAVGGRDIPCYVLKLESQGITWWVDKKEFRVLREDSTDGSGLFTKVRLGDPMSGT